MLDIALLGTGGMMPLPNRYLTSLLLRLNGRMLLIDCGEGTQVTLKMLGWGFKCIDTVCFTHFHADHISGLVGLLLTIGNSGRTEPLRLIGVTGLRTIVESLRIIAPELPFELVYEEVDEGGGDIKAGEYNISMLPVEHRISCFAYRIDVKRRGMFDVEKARMNNIPQRLWSQLQKNDEVIDNGVRFTSDLVLGEGRKGLRVSYCTDCRPSHRIEEFVKASDLFVCEGMYGEEEQADKAAKYKHMTFYDAARMARNADVNELWLTHFSPSLVNPMQYSNPIREVFTNTVVGYDRLTKTLGFDKG